MIYMREKTQIFVLKMHHVCMQLLTRIPFYLECAVTQFFSYFLSFFFFFTTLNQAWTCYMKRRVLHKLERKMKWIKHTGYVHLPREVEFMGHETSRWLDLKIYQ